MRFGHLQEVREWWIPTMGLSAPLILDPTTRSLRRSDSSYARREWAEIDESRFQRRVDQALWRTARRNIWDAKRTADKRWLAERFLRRMEGQEQLAAVAFSGRIDTWKWYMINYENRTISQTTLALDSAYTINSAGDAIAGKLQIHAAKTLQDVYFHVTGYTGTAANVNDITLEVRPEASAGASTPHATTLTEGKSLDPASATGWIKSTGWSASLSAASRYFVIVGDADGGGTDFATVLVNVTTVWESPGARPALLPSVRTTGGFASGNTNSSSPASLVLAFSDGTVAGNSLTASTTPASDTNRRGLRITATALLSPLSIFGITWSNASSSISGMEIWEGSTGPSGTADHVSTDMLYASNATSVLGAMVSGGAAYTLSALSAYSLVATYSGATTAGPRRHDVGTGEDAALRKAMPGAGEFYFRRADGTSDWSNDLSGSVPAMGVLIDSQVAASGGGGLLVHPGMSGGMRG